MVHIVGANGRDRENPQHAQMPPAQRVERNKTQAQTNLTSPLVTAFSLAALGLENNERERLNLPSVSVSDLPLR